MELTLADVIKMQTELYALHKDTWHPRDPENGRNHILYMIEEIGEMISIIKKKGERAIVEDSQVRTAFVEEMADVMMYFADVLLCYQITPDEFAESLRGKHNKNCKRNYKKEYEDLYHG